MNQKEVTSPPEEDIPLNNESSTNPEAEIEESRQNSTKGDKLSTKEKKEDKKSTQPSVSVNPKKNRTKQFNVSAAVPVEKERKWNQLRDYFYFVGKCISISSFEYFDRLPI